MKTICKCATALLLFLFFVSTGAQAQSTGSADSIVGSFADKDNGTTVEVYKEKNQYFGKITMLTNSGGKARVGTILLRNLTYVDNQWNGKIYAPKREQEYPVTITLNDPGTMVLKVDAGMMTRTLTWKRVQS